MTNVLVCVTRKESAKELIQYGKDFIKDENDNLFIVNIGSYEMYYLNKTEEEQDLDYLYELVLKAGGDIKVIRSNNAIESIFNYIKEHEISMVVIEDLKQIRGLKRIENKTKEAGMSVRFDYIPIEE